jgi:DNA topoisomerase-1
MADTIFDATQVDIKADTQQKPDYLFRASGSILKFDGFRVLYMEAKDDEGDGESDDENQEKLLPPMKNGDPLHCNGHKPEQHFTKPPPRYTEASLIKTLEELGIGRPSTYAPIVSTLVDREYVTRERGTLTSTRLGQVVSDSLVSHFPDIMNLEFTAQLEEQLDDVANGRREWVPLLREFYTPFSEAVEKAHEVMPRVRIEEPTDETCDKCNLPMVIKRGKFGPFIACSGFPECRNSKPIIQNTGAKCPKCDGDMLQRQAKGRPFFGCSNYPNCTFTISKKPLPEPCPECEGLLVAYRRDQSRCTNCAYSGNIEELSTETSDSTETASAF